jgi:rhodanese-related sulfurtransferase
VALICRTGGRSIKAAERLAAAGFTHILNVSDGMLGRGAEARGWIAAGQPVKPWSAAGDQTAAGGAHR